MLQTILDMVFSKEAIGLLLASGLPFLAKFIVGAVRRRNIALGTYYVFHIVEDIADAITDGSTTDKVFDKAAEGLKQFDNYMKANGWRPLKPGEQEVALLKFKALHGEDIVAEKLAVAVAEASTAGKAQP